MTAALPIVTGALPARPKDPTNHNQSPSILLPPEDADTDDKFSPPSAAPSKTSGSGTVLPAYCDPPNPCPLGYTEKDGCLEDFENTSEFSRNYQVMMLCLIFIPFASNQHPTVSQA